MIYIRTKDEILKAIHHYWNGYKAVSSKGVTKRVANEEVIAKSKEILDLCDFWMYRNHLDEHDYIIRPTKYCSSTKESLTKSLKEDWIFDVKLGILTDKGILFVAKLTEEGIDLL